MCRSGRPDTAGWGPPGGGAGLARVVSCWLVHRAGSSSAPGGPSLQSSFTSHSVIVLTILEILFLKFPQFYSRIFLSTTRELTYVNKSPTYS